jgi:2-oxoglutarate/2-oxoacid ferredoxin oxidoreductase subunit alpha
MTHDELEAGKEFGRYLDVDGDGIPYRTLPGTHPTRGSFFTRGTSRDRYARYTEEGGAYQDNMQRLLKKFETAKKLVPAPVKRPAKQPTKFGAIYYGSTAPAMAEALDGLESEGLHVDALRVRGFPFADEVIDFVRAHDHVFVIEQNRDGQLRALLTIEGNIDPSKLIAVLHYDGTPITARFIKGTIGKRLGGANVTPLRKVVS